MPRVIYSLEIMVSPPDEWPRRQVILTLDRNGQSPTAKAVTKRRIIDLRVGDEFEQGDKAYQIHEIKAYRDAQYSGLFNDDCLGYVVTTDGGPQQR